MTERIRVGVVMGGRSSEHEISLESGRHIHNALDPARFEKLSLYMDASGGIWEIGLPLLVQNTTRDIEARLEADATRIRYEELPERVDFVYIGLHGKYGEDGCFQGLLELLDLPYSGSGVLGSALGMDKRVQRHLLKGAGLDVPKTHAIDSAAWAKDRDAELAKVAESPGYPCVVKPAREGCSTALAVIEAEDADALAAAIDEALIWDRTALVEERLDGKEVTVVVLEEAGKPRAYAPTETPPTGDYLTIEEKFLPGQGVNVTPARLPEAQLNAVMRAAEASFATLGLRTFARIDMYITDSGRIVIGEPNTLPGSSPSSTIFLGPMEEDIGPMDLLTRIVEDSMRAHAGKKGPLD